MKSLIKISFLSLLMAAFFTSCDKDTSNIEINITIKVKGDFDTLFKYINELNIKKELTTELVTLEIKS